MKKLLLLSLGSNLGNRADFLAEAEKKLSQVLGPAKLRSDIYETLPQGVSGHPLYLNQVLAFECTMPAENLLATCQTIEAALGRTGKNELLPRTIDIDLLGYGNEILQTPDLTLPHPSMHLRSFVLTPLAEILPDWMHPVLGQSASELLSGLME